MTIVLPWIEVAMAASRKGRALRGDRAVNLVELDLTQLELGNVEAAWQSFVQATSILDELQPTHDAGARGSPDRHGARSPAGFEPAEALRALQAVDAYWRERRPDSWAGEAVLWLGRTHLALKQRVEARTGPRLQTFASSTIPADVALMKQLRHAASWTG